MSALVAGDLAGPELARRLEPFGLRERAGALVLAPSRAARGPGRGGARAGGARGGRRRPRRPGGQASCARCCRPPRRRRAVRARRAPARAGGAGGGRAARRPAPGGPSRPATCGAASTRRAARWRRGRCRSTARRRPTASSRPTATSAPSSCCSRSRTTTRCGCSATRSSAPIEESEGAYGGELMRSLEAFIECNGQWERAAKALFCHRHTLRYRIRRVEELTGRSLDSARDRIDFWLALRGRELVQHRKELDEGRRPHRDQDGRVPRRADAGRSARAGRARPRSADPGRRGRGLGDRRRRVHLPGRAHPARRRRRCSRRPT